MDYRLAPALIVTTLLTACGGSSDDSNPAENSGNVTSGTTGSTTNIQSSGLGDNVELVGFVNIFEDEVDNETETFGVFLKLDQSRSVPRGLRAIDGLQDHCTVESSSGVSSPDNPDAAPLNTISAGEVITLTTRSGTFGELTRSTAFGLTSYFNDTTFAGTIPGDISISIPGDEFPAFEPITLRDIDPVAGFTPAPISVAGADATFTWTSAGTANDTAIVFAMSTPDVQIICVAVDDGSFQISATTQSEINTLAGAGAQFFIEGAIRQVFQLVQRGNAAVVATRTAE